MQIKLKNMQHLPQNTLPSFVTLLCRDLVDTTLPFDKINITSNKIYGYYVLLDVFSLTHATFPGISATMSSGPTFYLPAFYTRPSLPSLPRITSPFIPAQVNPVPLPGTISILSFSALHDGLCSSPSCSSCVTSCTIISYNTIHLEIT